ncbi:hypothetical protein [Ochrobactrum sp. RH2CCR150]|uniref:hypothetical protein n=1 Tax=Ochrobactrum sp. RH2CCR150 TaxID=2587044 RepID=UPI0015F874B2|nr:hypothetical protein [Ochrobactrum sp. RH2CCR150]
MAKFKVGDRVKILQDDPLGGYRVGDILTVTGIDGAYVEFIDNDGDERSRDEDEFAPIAEATGKPAFKVGDRVRLIKDGLSTTGAVGKLATIEAWSGGKVVDNGQYLLNIDGPVDYETLAVRPQYTRASPKCFELLAPSLAIETGKFYRTRDGRKVGPITRTGFKELVWESNDCYYDEDGRALYLESTNDLIAEWVDDPASNDNQPVAEQQAGTVFIDASKAGPSQLHVAKGPLVRLNKGYYGYELARFGDYVWVEIGQKAPIVMRADAVTVAA